MGNLKGSKLLSYTQPSSLISWRMLPVFLITGGATFLCAAMNPELALLSYPVLLGSRLGAAIFLWVGRSGHAGLLKLSGMCLMSLTAVPGRLGLP